jgi:hypothetical protein
MREDMQQLVGTGVISRPKGLISETTDPHLGSAETTAQPAAGLLYIIRLSLKQDWV